MNDDGEYKKEYLTKLCDHLSSNQGVPIRSGKLVDQGNKQIQFFKGITVTFWII